MILGNKDSFAIEYKRSSAFNRGFGRFWIQGKYYGVLEDEIYLTGYLGNTVKDLLSASDLDTKFLKKDSDALFNHLLQSGDKDLYSLMSSTFTDDFIGFKFRKDERVYLVWKLEDRGVFEELKTYGTEAHLCSAPIKEIEDVLKDFLDNLTSK